MYATFFTLDGHSVESRGPPLPNLVQRTRITQKSLSLTKTTGLVANGFVDLLFASHNVSTCQAVASLNIPDVLLY